MPRTAPSSDLVGIGPFLGFALSPRELAVVEKRVRAANKHAGDAPVARRVLAKVERAKLWQRTRRGDAA